MDKIPHMNGKRIEFINKVTVFKDCSLEISRAHFKKHLNERCLKSHRNKGRPCWEKIALHKKF